MPLWRQPSPICRVMLNALIPNGIDRRGARNWVSNPALRTMTESSLQRPLKYLPMSFHRPFNRAIDVFRPWKKPFLLIILLIAVLIDGERPILHFPGVFQTTDGMETSIILPIQIEELPFVARDVDTMGIAYYNT